VIAIGVLASTASVQNAPKETAYAAVERNRDEIAKVGDAIFSFAELGMQEHETAKLCADVLTDMGYQVENGVSGMPTALMAT
jgi:aminobenzoyl-glutamate utilization protein B